MEEQFTEGAKQVAEASCSIDWVTLLTLATSIVVAIGAVVAIVVAILIAKSQKRIALLETRLRILKNIEDFVEAYFPAWDTYISKSPIKNYSYDQVSIMFDEELGEFFNRIISDFKKKNELIGDEAFAERHGECHGKDSQQIVNEIYAIDEKLSADFKVQKERAYKKWIKV